MIVDRRRVGLIISYTDFSNFCIKNQSNIAAMHADV